MKFKLMLFHLILFCCIIASDMALANESLKLKGIEFIKSQSGIEEYRLKNGLKILLRENKLAPMISWQLWYKVGSRNEDESYTGMAHFLEHMMFKGTKTFKKGEISQAIQIHGGIFNAFTSDDYTAYFENFSPENLELAIKIEADRMRNSRLDPQEMDLERTVIVSELEGGENNPQVLLYQSLKSNAYKVHKYKNPVIGLREDLKNINHNSMKEFYDNYYSPDNAVALLAGNFDKEVALQLIEKYFGSYKVSTNKKSKKIISREPIQNETREIEIKSGGQVKLMALAFHIPEFTHDDTPAFHILGDLLSSGTNSRLYKKLVDEGLAVKVSAYPEASLDPGIFRIIVNLSLESNPETVQRLILEELESLKTTENISNEELEIAIARANSSAIYDRDGVYEEALQIGYFEAISNDWTKYLSWEESLSKVTLEDLSRISREYFRPQNMTVVKLLPEKASESLLSPLDNFDNAKALEYGYGATSVEALDPKDLEKLLKKTQPKYSKAYVKRLSDKKLELGIKELVLSDLAKDSKLLLREDHSLPIVYMNLALYAGSIKDLEQDAKTGLAYITSEMLERGTLKHTKYEISDLLDRYGAEISFENKKESTWIELGFLKKHIREVTEILREILLEPAFDQTELEKLKQEVVAKIIQEDEYSSKVALREFRMAIYPENHPFRPKSQEDRIKSILAITVDDVKNFYSKYFSPSNLNISIVGDISESEALDLISSCLKNWNTGAPESTRPYIETVPMNEPKTIEIKKENKRQTEIIMGHSGQLKRTDKDFYPMLLANYILGGNSLSSRLGKTVRDEHGYVYNVNSNFAASLGAGAFTIRLGVNPKNVDDAIKLTKNIVKEFIAKGVTETELRATKSYLKGSFGARNLSSNDEISDTLAQMMIYGIELDYIENYSKIIDSITAEEVNSAIKKYIHPESFTIVKVGP
jgi:zinc protease